METASPGKKKLVFLTVNSSYSHSSLALPLLHNACRELSQWEWYRCDVTLKEEVMTAVRQIAAKECDLLAAPLYLFNRQRVLEILQRVHVLLPQCRIVVGGPECLGEGAETLLRESPWLDCIFRGEGEELFFRYLKEFDTLSQEKPKILPEKGNGIFTPWENSDFPVNDPFFVTDKPFVQVETSRGCPMRCFYCTSGNTQVRYRSLEAVREELSVLYSRGVREVRLLDRTFNFPLDRGRKLLQMFREEFPEMHFHLELHPQLLDDPLKEELRKALPGQLHIEAGVQCLDNEIQRLVGRNSDTAAVLEGIGFLTSLSAFETHVDLLAGLPVQGAKHIFADAAALITLNAAEIQLEVLKVLPGTPLREIALRHGICYTPDTPYDVMKTDTITLEEMQQVRDFSRLLDMTYNHSALHSVIFAINKELPGFLPDFLDFFRRKGGSSATVWDLKKRFLFVFDFCCSRQLECAKRELALQWLLAGFPQGQGADIFSVRCGTPPAEACLLSPSDDCLKAVETRYWSLSMGDERIYYIAYNRNIALHLPAAFWLAGK